MSNETQPRQSRHLTEFNRSLTEQILENLEQAVRVIELMEGAPSDLTPHPLVVARAEIRNAQRYLAELDMVIDEKPIRKNARRSRSNYDSEIAAQL